MVDNLFALKMTVKYIIVTFVAFIHVCRLFHLIVFTNMLPGGGRVERRCWVNFQCLGVLLVWMIVGQGPIALAVGAGGDCLDIFPSSIFSLFFLLLFGRRPDID